MGEVSELLQSLLGYGEENLNGGQMMVRAVVTFIVTLAIVRIGDKRIFGKGTAFDTIVAIMIGSVMSRGITGSGPLIGIWLAGMTLVGLHWLVALMSYHFSWFGPLVKGNPVKLVGEGKVLEEGMRDGSVSERDLEQALRAQGVPGESSQVEAAYLERDGSISVVERKQEPRILDVTVANGVQTVRIAVN